MEKKNCVFFLLIFSLCFPSVVFADTITLKSGQKIEGKILDKTDNYIEIEINGVPFKYFSREIESSDKEASNRPPLNQETKDQDTKDYLKEMIGLMSNLAHKDLEQATQNFQNILSKNPQSPQAYIGLGAIYYAKKDYNKAIEYIQKGLSFNPKDSMDLDIAYLGLASSYVDTANFDKAMEYANKAKDIDGNDYLAYYLLGTSYAGKGDFDKAIEYLTKSISIKPDHGMSYLGLGGSYAVKKDLQKAKENMIKAKELLTENKQIIKAIDAWLESYDKVQSE